jgi:hypothetical protein
VPVRFRKEIQEVLRRADRELTMKRLKERAASRIETDLSRIKALSQEHDDENWDFRSWLKQNAPHNIDGIIQGLSQKYFTLIDCK